MNEHHDDSLIDKAKRFLGMGDDEHRAEHGADATGTATSSRYAEGDEHGELAGQPHSAEQGHFINDPPLHERPSAHPTSGDAGVSDAARLRSSPLDANEDPAQRRDEYTETGAASGQIAMPGGEEPVVGDEDRDDRGRGIG